MKSNLKVFVGALAGRHFNKLAKDHPLENSDKL